MPFFPIAVIKSEKENKNPFTDVKMLVKYEAVSLLFGKSMLIWKQNLFI